MLGAPKERWTLLLKGIIIGLVVAAPLGPVGLLCVRRTLIHGRLSGQLSGFGAATAHSLYGLVVGLGLTGISSFLLQGQLLLGVAGGLFLCYLGIKTFCTKPGNSGAPPQDKSRLQNYFSTLALALTNPLTILSFLGIFAGFRVQGGSIADPVLLGVGIFFGSALWWLMLTFVVGLFQRHMSPRAMLIVNKTSGICIFLFGITAVMKV